MDDLVTTTLAARERAGEEAFDQTATRAAILAAGKDGFTSCIVGPRLPLNLKETRAAKALLVWLHADGFQVQWAQRPLIDPKPGGETVFDLVISWRV